MTHDSQPPGPQAALEALAAALDPRDYITTLTTSEHRAPQLTVTSRHAQHSDDIYADHQSYWWSWAERIATVDDPVAAARKITAVLRAAPEPSVADRRPAAPGLDEIAVAAAPGRCLCNSREHARLGCLAEVTVTFGDLGTRGHPGALWPECWGRSYPLCGECWDTVRQIAASRRPGLAINQATSPPAQLRAPAGSPRVPGITVNPSL